MQRQPGATRLLVSATQYVRHIGPPVRILCWTGVKLIAIACDDKRVVGADPVRDDDEADGSDSRVFDPVINQASCDGDPKRQLRKSRAQLLTRKPLRVFKFAVVQDDFCRRRCCDESEHQ